MTFLKSAWPYLLAALLGAAAGASVEHLIGARELADEQAARAIAAHDAAASQVAGWQPLRRRRLARVEGAGRDRDARDGDVDGER